LSGEVDMIVVVKSSSRYLNELRIDRALEAAIRSSASRRVRPATVIRCGGVDPFAAAELAIAELVGTAR
jgi:hypothetical protein